ncbi:phosphoglycerate mutase [Pseudozyma hubeiensis SY62]|uniref:Phosphoglycerate mutase n=1 Tax=Pseudozyma hubeiensis (strain SY62) TaxID=1305764 RepID=R9PEF1_PSEHS|nr:phosphoglycerate mutase [Pseudozyma hubeiensis SY62]GAC99743.1 phosphoglycerate mutase [Pseudozyma hubeiensis SY62]
MQQYAILTLIRHAETTGNLNRLLQGVTDSPVTVFGQAQIDALARTWSTTRTVTAQGAADDVKFVKEAVVSKLDLPPPTLIVCSPIGRARKTAEAVHRACTSTEQQSAGISEDAIAEGSRATLASDLHSKPGLPLVIDPGLKEKDFGWKESTRGGVHVAGFPKGHGNGESRTDFAARVYKVGLEWLNAASVLGFSPSSEADPTSVPHIVLVSHGMWISTFLSAHPPTTITQAMGQPTYLPFAANTGMFSLKVHPRTPEAVTTRPVTELFKANDIRHLEHVKRQKGGIGRGAFDSKQTKLSSFFAKPAKEEQEASPTKKRKM